MNHRNRITSSLLLSSLILGPAVVVASAASAAPTAACSMTPQTGGATDVIVFHGTGFPSNTSVKILGSSAPVGADGSFSFTYPGTSDAAVKATVTVTGTDVNATCILVGATPPNDQKKDPPQDQQKDPNQDQNNKNEQFRKGFRDGNNDAREDCKKNPPKPGVAGPDPSYESGYLAGQDAGFKRYCANKNPQQQQDQNQQPKTNQRQNQQNQEK
ncbi:hypothetical protein ACFWBH_24825 [Streptomyces sp. NPDC059999]|uniref:hypothetical protein n=1 Tax=Streptomyces sp. NPDC059999 TaxID=3347030 RepID=UPI0036AAEE3A